MEAVGGKKGATEAEMANGEVLVRQKGKKMKPQMPCSKECLCEANGRRRGRVGRLPSPYMAAAAQEGCKRGLRADFEGHPITREEERQTAVRIIFLAAG